MAKTTDAEPETTENAEKPERVWHYRSQTFTVRVHDTVTGVPSVVSSLAAWAKGAGVEAAVQTGKTGRVTITLGAPQRRTTVLTRETRDRARAAGLTDADIARAVERMIEDATDADKTRQGHVEVTEDVYI